MSTEEKETKPQSTPKNSLIVGIIVGAGLGMVFGNALVGDSRNGFVYGAMLGGALGLVFNFFFAGHAAQEGEANDPGA